MGLRLIERPLYYAIKYTVKYNTIRYNCKNACRPDISNNRNQTDRQVVFLVI